MKKVLFVDDDANIVSAYKGLLHEEFQIETALCGEEGLTILDALGPFAVAVADMRMPGMDGVQFLASVKKRSPITVRIMLTGNADLQTAINALNESSVFRILTKPCPIETLTKSLNAGVRQHQLITAEQELTRKTLLGAVRMLIGVISQAEPMVFSRTTRITRYAQMVATRMQLPDLWQIELASMLSQIGCLALPRDILSKLNSGRGLSVREHMMYSSHPSFGTELLANIPRLGPITRMIKQQLKPFRDYVPTEDIAHEDVTSLGAQVLRVAIGLEQMLTRGLSYGKALVKMREQPNEYNPKIMDTL